MGPITLDVNIPRPQKNAKLFISDGPSERFFYDWMGRCFASICALYGRLQNRS